MPGWVADLAARVGALLTKGGLWMGVAISAGLAVTLTSIVISVGALLFYRYQLPNNRPWIQISVGMIVGGAIGNIIDRIRYGYVVDFVHVRWFPGIFNVADSAIVVGAGLLVIEILFGKSSAPPKPA